ncbi:MAG: hypothetical protein AAGD96_15045 [Chloroflexota bacterium]
MSGFSLIPILGALATTLPLFLIVLSGVIYAFIRRDIGRPANFVIIGGCLVLLVQLSGMAVTATITSGFASVSTYSTIAMVNGIVSMILGTIGWGMILFAVFLDRSKSDDSPF